MRMIPLGGCGVFGRNMTAYEAASGAVVVVDCGAQFPEIEAPGVDLFLPDFTWLERVRDRVRAFVITHAHEDHLRALPFALARCPAPVYARPFTLRMADGLLREHQMKGELRPMLPGNEVDLDGVTLSALAVAHSIPDACALALVADGRRVVHTGDLKLELDEEGRADSSRACARSATPASTCSRSTRPTRGGPVARVGRPTSRRRSPRASPRCAGAWWSPSSPRTWAAWPRCAASPPPSVVRSASSGAACARRPESAARSTSCAPRPVSSSARTPRPGRRLRRFCSW